jgi:hypothetical protein
MVMFITNGDTHAPWRVEAAMEAMETCSEAGIPVYPNARRAVNALARFAGYYRRIMGS